MSDENNALPSDIFRDQVWQRFEGHSETATVEDLANMYRAILLLHENLLTVTEVALNQKRLNFADLTRMKERANEMVQVIAKGLTMLDTRVPEDE